MTDTVGNSEAKIALVTGATRGIGAAIAQRLCAAGWRVVATGTSAQGVAQMQRQNPQWLEAHVLDVNDSPACEALIEHLVQAHGGLHALVNNAGITRDMLAMRMKDADWDAVIGTNLSAAFRLSRSVLRPMMKQRAGRIINITSVVGASGNPGQVNYAAAKAGLAGMTRALARELGSRNITVNCVAPGFIATDMTAALNEQQQAALRASIPLGRLGEPDDVAHAVVFLASDQARYITGQELHVNGGMYML